MKKCFLLLILCLGMFQSQVGNSPLLRHQYHENRLNQQGQTSPYWAVGACVFVMASLLTNKEYVSQVLQVASLLSACKTVEFIFSKAEKDQRDLQKLKEDHQRELQEQQGNHQRGLQKLDRANQGSSKIFLTNIMQEFYLSEDMVRQQIIECEQEQKSMIFKNMNELEEKRALLLETIRLQSQEILRLKRDIRYFHGMELNATNSIDTLSDQVCTMNNGVRAVCDELRKKIDEARAVQNEHAQFLTKHANCRQNWCRKMKKETM